MIRVAPLLLMLGGCGGLDTFDASQRPYDFERCSGHNVHTVAVRVGWGFYEVSETQICDDGLGYAGREAPVIVPGRPAPLGQRG